MSRLEEIAERCEKATPEPIKKVRYDHGGGRAFVDADPRDRDLVMDCYNERDREFYFHALADMQYLRTRLEAAERYIVADFAFDAAARKRNGALIGQAENERQATLKAWLAAKGEAR